MTTCTRPATVAIFLFVCAAIAAFLVWGIPHFLPGERGEHASKLAVMMSLPLCFLPLFFGRRCSTVSRGC